MDRTELFAKDQMISTNCQELKKIIMTKTRELFDKNNDFLHKTDRILKNSNENSPRKTRSSAQLKNLLTSSQESLNFSSVGPPISCSTFAGCEFHESCNSPRPSSSKPKPGASSSKPSVRNVQSCNYLLFRRNSSEAETIFGQQPMELTPVQSRNIPGTQNSEKFPENRFSMDVNTSLDNVGSKNPEDDAAGAQNHQDFQPGREKMPVIDEENESRNPKSDEDPDVVADTPEFTQKSRFLTQRNFSKLLSPKNSRREEEKKDQLESTIILEDFSLSKDPRVSKKGTVIIDETSEESGNDSDADRNKFIMETVKKKLSIGKRRLFTQQSSPVALTPMSSGLSLVLSPKRKKLARRRVRRSLHASSIRTRSQSSLNNASFSPRKDPGVGFSQPGLEILDPAGGTIGGGKRRKGEKPGKKKRVIKSKKIVVGKKSKRNLLGVGGQKAREEAAAEDDSARSSNVFMESKRLIRKSRVQSKAIVVVSTGLCSGDKEIVKEAIKKLGGAKMESVVTKKTTHVVTTGVRTINLLRGIIRGCWLITFEWVKKSMEASVWLPPDKFEIQHFSKVLKENRRDREIFGNSYVPELFTTCGLIHIQNNSTPPRELLKELIKTAGGLTIDDPKKAKITIGPTGVKELWVLDSITTGELQPPNQYKR